MVQSEAKSRSLRVFGSLAYAVTPSQGRRKLDDRFEPSIFIGYINQTDGYRLYNPVSKRFFTRRDVDVREQSKWEWEEKANKQMNESNYVDPFPASDDHEVNHEENSESAHTQSSPDEASQSTTRTSGSSNQQTPMNSQASSTNSLSSLSPTLKPLSDVYLKAKKVKANYETHTTHDDDDPTICQFALNVADPITYNEALTKKEWKHAMKEEIHAIEKNNTWNLVKLPAGKNLVGLKWLFKTKISPNEEILRHKARLVAKGYS
ncbi:putative RNA-directed DNA polymerase [Helianthus annuus]|nr:putative RNA-directed DNA polymerase [Helianthus annuus]